MNTKLTKREQEIYHELVTNPGALVQIGKKLNLSITTVRTYMQKIGYKMGGDELAITEKETKK